MSLFNMEETLIKAVANHPELYDTNCFLYRDRNKKNLAWRNISEETGLPEYFCRKKWKSIRDTYMKEKKKEDEKRKVPGAEAGRKWKFSAVMRFLDPFLNPRETSSSSSMEGVDVRTEEENILPGEQGQPVEAAGESETEEPTDSEGVEPSLSASPGSPVPRLSTSGAAPTGGPCLNVSGTTAPQNGRGTDGSTAESSRHPDAAPGASGETLQTVHASGGPGGPKYGEDVWNTAAQLTTKRRKVVVNAMPATKNEPSSNAGSSAPSPESIKPHSIIPLCSNSTTRPASLFPTLERGLTADVGNNQLDERSQQVLVLQQHQPLDQLRLEGDSKERDAFTEWLRSAMHNFEHSIWRRCQRELNDIMYRYIAENDSLRACNRPLCQFSAGPSSQGRFPTEQNDLEEYKWQPK